jgi:hypothetical protein
VDVIKLKNVNLYFDRPFAVSDKALVALHNDGCVKKAFLAIATTCHGAVGSMPLIISAECNQFLASVCVFADTTGS